MNTRWWRVSIVTAIATLVFVVSVLTTPPATGYEGSIYAVYPIWTWIGFGIAIVGSLVLLFRSAIADRPGWYYGVGMLGSVYAVFFALPLFRGYYLYGTPMSDSFYHFAIVREVLQTGSIPDTGYPATHLLYTTLSLITGQPSRELQPLVSFSFFLFFVGSCFLLGLTLFGRRGGIATLGASVPLLFVSHHLTTLPWLFALPYLPLSLYFCHRWTDRGRSSRRRIFGVMLLCGLALVFYHPVTALGTILAIVLYAGIAVVPRVRRRLPLRRADSAPSNRASAVPYRYPLVIGISAVLWYLSTSHVRRFLERVFTTDVDGGATEYASTAQETSYSTWELFWEFLVLQWGTVLLYSVVGACIAAVISIRLLRRRASRLELLCVSQFGAGIVVALLSVGSGVLSRNIVRINHYTLIGVILLIGLTITGLLSYRVTVTESRKRQGATVVLRGLCVTVIVVALLAGAIAYQDDRHVTRTTMAGGEWQHEHHESDIDTRAVRMSEQLPRYFEGATTVDPNDRQFHRSLEGYQLPSRLGYAEHESVADTYESETYFVTKTADVEWAADRPDDRRDGHYYTAADLDRLRADPAAHRIYSNGDFSVWLVDPEA